MQYVKKKRVITKIERIGWIVIRVIKKNVARDCIERLKQ